MTKEEQEKVVIGAIRILCEHINMTLDLENPEVSAFTVDQFMVTDYEKNLSGETTWTVLEDTDPSNFWAGEGLMKIVASNGDDGGPSVLYVAVSEGIEWIVHIFDTIPTMIWSHTDGYIKS